MTRCVSRAVRYSSTATPVWGSSLLRYAAEDEGIDLVSVDSLSSKRYEDLLEDAVRKLIDVKEIKRQRTTSGSAEVQADAGISKIVSLRRRLKGEHSRQREFEVVEKPLIDVVIEAMRASGRRPPSVRQLPERHGRAGSVASRADDGVPVRPRG